MGFKVGRAISLVFGAVHPLDDFVRGRFVILNGLSGTMLKGQTSLRSEDGHPTPGVLGFRFVVLVEIPEIHLAVAFLAFVDEGLAIIAAGAVRGRLLRRHGMTVLPENHQGWDVSVFTRVSWLFLVCC